MRIAPFPPKSGRRVPRVRPGVESLEGRWTPATFLVTSVADSGPGSLRQAVVDASRNDEPDTIGFDASLAGQTITLAAGPKAYYFGPTGLVIDHDDVEIDGGDAPFLQISGGGAARVFAVTGGGSLALRRLTVTGGLAQGGAGGAGGNGSVARGGGGGGGGAGLGGAVFVDGSSLTIRESTFVDNRAVGGRGGDNGDSEYGGGGGGMGGAGQKGKTGPAPKTARGGGLNGSADPGALAGRGGGGAGGGHGPFPRPFDGGGGGFGGGGGGGFRRWLFLPPMQGLGGGGGFGGGGGAGRAYNDSSRGGFGGGRGGVATGSSYRDPAGGGGGGAGMGGAVFNRAGSVIVVASTFTGNEARGGAGGPGGDDGRGLGGAIFNLDGSLSVVRGTIAMNRADQGSAVYSLGLYGSATAALSDTIAWSGSTSVADLVSDAAGGGEARADGGGNLIGVARGFSGTIAGRGDPRLAPLSDNGGPTPTMRPADDSPAIDAGEPLDAGLATDQRGELRRGPGLSVDIGAVEGGARRRSWQDSMREEAASTDGSPSA